MFGRRVEREWERSLAEFGSAATARLLPVLEPLGFTSGGATSAVGVYEVALEGDFGDDDVETWVQYDPTTGIVQVLGPWSNGYRARALDPASALDAASEALVRLVEDGAASGPGFERLGTLLAQEPPGAVGGVGSYAAWHSDLVSRAGLDKEPRDVARMFDTVARRYDLTNDVLSLGQDRRWRHRVVELVDPRPGELVLDLAAGTGTSSRPFADAGATVVPCDFSLGMLRVGRRQYADLPFVAGDGMGLPFADDAFDAVTISFGLRNIHDPLQGLRELLRVTRPGGRIVVCEFSRPTWTPFASVYTNYLMRALPTIARRVSSNPESYVYLAESIRAWPDQKGLALRMVEAGWGRVEWHNLSAGIVALHHSVKPV